MKPIGLAECFAKIEWAKTEIAKLAGVIDVLIAAPRFNLPRRKFPLDWPTRPYPPLYPTGIHKVTSHIDANGIQVWRFAGPTIPESTNVIAGAILHTVRSPLDQMLSAIVVHNGGAPEGVAFPFGRTRDEFERALKKQEKLPADAHKMIEILRPYRDGGNILLYALHLLNRDDKHRLGLVPINFQTVANFEGCITWRGSILTLGPRTGRHYVRDVHGNLSQSDPLKMPAAILVNEEPRAALGSLVGAKPKNFISKIYNQSKLAKVPPNRRLLAESGPPCERAAGRYGNRDHRPGDGI